MRPPNPLPRNFAHAWTPSEKWQVVMTLIQGKDTLAGLAHEHGLSVQTLEGWRSEYLPEILHPVGLPMSESELRLGQEVQRLKAEVAALRQRCQAPDIPNW